MTLHHYHWRNNAIYGAHIDGTGFYLYLHHHTFSVEWRTRAGKPKG